MLARSNVVMEGYWEQPEATAGAIVDGWFHTGDGGSIDEFGYVTISDRKKDVIISGGENVSSIEVEDAIFQHPDVTEVAVIGIPDEKWGELVTALVVKAPGSELDRRGRHRLDPPEAGRLQVPEAGRVPRRPRPHGHRQAAEVQAARPVLGGPAAPGQLKHSVRLAAELLRLTSRASPPLHRSGVAHLAGDRSRTMPASASERSKIPGGVGLPRVLAADEHRPRHAVGTVDDHGVGDLDGPGVTEGPVAERHQPEAVPAAGVGVRRPPVGTADASAPTIGGDSGCQPGVVGSSESTIVTMSDGVATHEPAAPRTSM